MSGSTTHKSSNGPKGPKMPLHADYHDDITDEQLEAIRAAVPQESEKDEKAISGPAW